MVSPETLHVVSTELVVGTFALAGLCFALKLLATFNILTNSKVVDSLDNIAHGALLFGLLALPFAILSGINSADANEKGFISPLLVNKMWLSFAGLGLAIGVLLSRWKIGIDIWNQSKSAIIQSSFGMAACGAILLTASLGGRVSRGESLLDIFNLPYDLVLLMPMWLSLIILISGITNIVMAIKAKAATEVTT